MNVLHPSCARSPRWSPPVLWRLFEDGSAASLKFTAKHPLLADANLRSEQNIFIEKPQKWLHSS